MFLQQHLMGGKNKIMKRLVALVYTYFCYKKLPGPYFRTIIFFAGFTIYHFFLIYAIFPIPKTLSPFGMYKIPIKNYVSGGIFLGSLYILLALVFDRNNLQKYLFNKEELQIGVRKLLIYFIILFFLIFLSSILHIRERW